jgi:hypothetical protein
MLIRKSDRDLIVQGPNQAAQRIEMFLLFSSNFCDTQLVIERTN